MYLSNSQKIDVSGMCILILVSIVGFKFLLTHHKHNYLYYILFIGGIIGSIIMSDKLKSDAIDCVLSNWGDCSTQCGGGTQSRTIVTAPSYDGKMCDSLVQSCNTQPCPVDCKINWNTPSNCSGDCGGGSGTVTMSGTIVDTPAYGGKACPVGNIIMSNPDGTTNNSQYTINGNNITAVIQCKNNDVCSSDCVVQWSDPNTGIIITPQVGDGKPCFPVGDSRYSVNGNVITFTG